MPILPDIKEETVDFTANKWWNVFADSALNNLEELALKRNQDLKQAVANIEIAAALAGVAFSDLVPSVGLSGKGDKNFSSTKTRTYAPGASRNSSDYLAVTGVSYEIDFFGKYRRAN
jgi:outer membrane protein TolC